MLLVELGCFDGDDDATKGTATRPPDRPRSVRFAGLLDPGNELTAADFDAGSR